MNHIGLKRLAVELLPHNKKWGRAFEAEAKKLRKLFPHLEHIGSTSINNIKAKPIIDMAAGIFTMAKAGDYIKPLKKLGYELRPFGSKNKHLFFAKGKENNRTHYLHVIKYNGQIWQNDVFFRNYLNKNKKAAQAYEKLKIQLASKFSDNRPQYTKAKGQFIKSIFAKRK